MNGITDDPKKMFLDAVVGRAVTVKGLVSEHDEALAKAGAQMLWDYIHGANLVVVKKS